MKVFVLENNLRLYESYLERVFQGRAQRAGREVELTHFTTALSLLKATINSWPDLFVIGYGTGKAARVMTPDGELILRNGADLIATLRALEVKLGQAARPILGTALHPAGRMFLDKAGASSSSEAHEVDALFSAYLKMQPR